MTQRNITEEGIAKVVDAYRKAIENEDRALKEYERAADIKLGLLKAVTCEHINLEDASSEGIMRTRCKDCGFVWDE